MPGRKCPVSEKGGVSDHEEPRGGKAAPVPRQIQVVLLNWQLRVSVQANEFCRIHSQRPGEPAGRTEVA